MKTILEISEDGSHTLFVPALNEHYHSTRGAIQESLHVYIETGLHQCDKREINLLEIGFGTGLNALLTLLDAGHDVEHNVGPGVGNSVKKIHYTAIERYPIELGDAERLNYSELLVPARKDLFSRLHISPWEEWVEITPNFRLKKVHMDVSRLDEFQPEELFDVIYYDAFAPDKQPVMWTRDIFNRLFALSNDGAVLTTYCAKGAVRRMLQAAGNRVERLPGPPGKREILRAVKRNGEE